MCQYVISNKFIIFAIPNYTLKVKMMKGINVSTLNDFQLISLFNMTKGIAKTAYEIGNNEMYLFNSTQAAIAKHELDKRNVEVKF